VDVVAFYDENRNGALDARERVRIPGAEVEIGGALGRTVAPGGTGRLDGVSGGSQLIAVHAAFVAAADGDAYSRLIADHVHPTPFGYDVMAHAMAEAITRRFPLATQMPGLQQRAEVGLSR
jgi:hypothetical protein